MNANPDLDPDIVEEECIIALKDFTTRITNKYPEIYCVFQTDLQHCSHQGSTSSYDVEIFQINFYKYPPNLDEEDNNFYIVVG